MAGPVEKLGTYPQISQPLYCGLCLEPFFSIAMVLSTVVDDFVKGCYALTMLDTYGQVPYVDRASKACGVLVKFSPAGCTWIRIAATLRYE
jgi:hypothetical protein